MKKSFENYPAWMVVVSNLVPLAIYAIGAYIIYQYGLVWLILYIAYLIFIEFSLYPKACVSCYYYGKVCAFGRGKIAALFFAKRDPQKFCQREAKWTNLIPDLLPVIVPVVAGIMLLVKDFDLLILILIIVQAVLWSLGNAFVRGKLACPNCAQGEICCPAKDMFMKEKR